MQSNDIDPASAQCGLGVSFHEHVVISSALLSEDQDVARVTDRSIRLAGECVGLGGGVWQVLGMDNTHKSPRIRSQPKAIHVSAMKGDTKARANRFSTHCDLLKLLQSSKAFKVLFHFVMESAMECLQGEVAR
ncbi:Uncharacterized protein DAT39_011808, partial [Clarias magur]